MRRHTKAEGYTLVELLIVVAIVGMVAAGILGVYQVSQGIYTRATGLEDAQSGARAGLDRMASELRLIGSFWVGASGAGNAITAATSASITFMADVNGDTVVNNAETTVAAGTTASGTTVQVSGTATQAADAFNVYPQSPALNDYVYIAKGGRREVKQISVLAGTTLTLVAPALTTTYPAGSLVRSVEIVTYNFAANSLTRSVGGSGNDTIIDNVTGLTLTYFDANGTSLGASPPPASIREIQMSLTTQGADGSRRTMTSRVRPRNLS
jgi:prepilin-type N-terminal cleavage/methylation domain-containing protein